MASKGLTEIADIGADESGLRARGRSYVSLVPRLEVRQSIAERDRLFWYAVSLATATGLSLLLLALSGVAPADVGREITTVAFSSPRALGSVLAQMAPLLVAGLATAIAFRANFWNIGLEGQMIVGAIFASGIAIYDIGPEPLRLPIMALAAMAGGVAWITGPALLKQKLGLSEVITTLLLNYVAFNLLLHLLYGPWKDPVSNFPHTQQYDAVERLPMLGWLNLTWTLPLAALLAFALWWIISISRVGYLLDMTSSNPEMARAVGIPVAGLTAFAVIASGAVGGLTGFAIASGIEFRMTQDFFSGYLFSGVLIAFLGRNHPIGVVVISFFLAILMLIGQSLQVFFGVPAALVQLIQAIYIICVAASDFFVTYRMRWSGA